MVLLQVRLCHSLNAFQSSILIQNIILTSQLNTSKSLCRATSPTLATGHGPRFHYSNACIVTSVDRDTSSEQNTAAEATVKRKQTRRRNWLALATANERLARDIHPRSLSATLEAHRKSNREPLISFVRQNPRDGDGQGKVLPTAARSPYNDFKQCSTKSTLVLPLPDNPVKVMGQGRIQPVALRRSRRMKKSQPLEYDGQALAPLVPMENFKSEVPWLRSSPALVRNAGGIERLSCEIKQFHEYLQPTTDEKMARRMVKERVASVIRETLPFCNIEVFGSERTGLALATSDIDMRLIPYKAGFKVFGNRSMFRPHVLRKHVRKLYWLHTAFQKSKDFTDCEVIHARFSLLSMRHESTGLEIQIVLCDDTSYSDGVIQSIIERHQNFKQVFGLLKTAFNVHGLDDALSGGIRSYCLLVMLIASFETRLNDGNKSSAESLLEFLEYWSNFDSYSKGVCAYPYQVFSKRHRHIKVKSSSTSRELLSNARARAEICVQSQLQPYLLCIQDPANYKNDLGAKAYSFKHIQATMKQMLKDLRHDLESDRQPSLLASVVGACHVLYESRRAMASKWARENSKELNS